MEKRITSTIVAMLLLFVLTASAPLFSQTAGTLSFSVTTTSSGGFSPDHYLALWIENAAGNFIKTKVAYTINDDLDHMQTWVTKSSENVTDATTGSTRTSHGTVTFLWNGTNVAGNVVTDGSYFVWLEMAWASSLTTGKTVNSFAFTKGASAFHSEPAGTANLSAIVLDWAPLSTGIEGTLESKDVNIYPNPSSGPLSIDFKRPVKECTLQIINVSGRSVFTEKVSELSAGVRTFDISKLSAGSYYCILRLPEKDIVFSIIRTK
jgi:hypothetical protein